MEALQNILISAASFVVVLSLVVFVHEFGHFQAARWCKIAVDTFSIGFGKSIASWRDKQGVLWKIGNLPLGGYVKFTGDADAVSSGPDKRIDDPAAYADARKKGLFHAQPLTSRAIVVAAGPMANFIFAILVFAAVAMIAGRDVTNYATLRPHIAGVAENTAAAAAGLRAGETVEAVNGQQVRGIEALQTLIAASPNNALVLTLIDETGARRDASVTPRLSERAGADGRVERVGMLGVSLGYHPSDIVIETVGPLPALQYGATQTWRIVSDTVGYIGGIVTGQNSGSEIAGPFGIFMASGQVAESALDQPPGGSPPQDRIGALLLGLLQWAAILSVAVGFVNLLPIPILDGGHLLFYTIEALRGGKPLPPAAQEWAFRAGLAVMASLFLFATWNDITRHLIGAPG